MMADNIEQDDFDTAAAMAQFEELDASSNNTSTTSTVGTASTVGVADAFIASMSADGVWEQHGEKRPAGVHYGIPTPASQGFTPWSELYSTVRGQSPIPPDEDDKQNEIMDAIANLESGINACVDVCKGNTATNQKYLLAFQRLMNENQILGHHIIAIESIVTELQASVKRLTDMVASTTVVSQAQAAQVQTPAPHAQTPTSDDTLSSQAHTPAPASANTPAAANTPTPTPTHTVASTSAKAWHY